MSYTILFHNPHWILLYSLLIRFFPAWYSPYGYKQTYSTCSSKKRLFFTNRKIYTTINQATIQLTGGIVRIASYPRGVGRMRLLNFSNYLPTENPPDKIPPNKSTFNYHGRYNNPRIVRVFYSATMTSHTGKGKISSFLKLIGVATSNLLLRRLKVSPPPTVSLSLPRLFFDSSSCSSTTSPRNSGAPLKNQKFTSDAPRNFWPRRGAKSRLTWSCLFGWLREGWSRPR